MPAVVYLHGFNSNSQSAKARETAAWLAVHAPDIAFHCPTLPHSPAAALTLASELIGRLPPDTLLIGSSLGGYYATALAERHDRRAVLINPAVRPFELLTELLGPQHNPYTGEDYTLTRQHLAELKAAYIARPDPQRYWLVLGSADETLNWREAAQHFAGCRQTVFNGDDHRLQRWPECLAALPAWLRGTR